MDEVMINFLTFAGKALLKADNVFSLFLHHLLARFAHYIKEANKYLKFYFGAQLEQNGETSS